MGRPPKTELTEAEQRRLIEVATRRVGGQSWTRIAADMGWGSRQAAQQWARKAEKLAQ